MTSRAAVRIRKSNKNPQALAPGTLVKTAAVKPFTAEDLADVRTPTIEQRLDDAEGALALALLVSRALSTAGDTGIGPRAEARAHGALSEVYQDAWKSLRAVQDVLYRRHNAVVIAKAPPLEELALQGNDVTEDAPESGR